MSFSSEPAASVGRLAELPVEEPFPGVRRQALTTRQLTLSRYTFEPGATFPLHSHPQEQLTLVEEGSVEITVAGSVTRLEAGDWSIVDPGVEHGIAARGDGARIIAIVSPARESTGDYDLSPEAASE